MTQADASRPSSDPAAAAGAQNTGAAGTEGTATMPIAPFTLATFGDPEAGACVDGSCALPEA